MKLVAPRIWCWRRWNTPSTLLPNTPARPEATINQLRFVLDRRDRSCGTAKAEGRLWPAGEMMAAVDPGSRRLNPSLTYRSTFA